MPSSLLPCCSWSRIRAGPRARARRGVADGRDDPAGARVGRARAARAPRRDRPCAVASARLVRPVGDRPRAVRCDGPRGRLEVFEAVPITDEPITVGVPALEYATTSEVDFAVAMPMRRGHGRAAGAGHRRPGEDRVRMSGVPSAAARRGTTSSRPAWRPSASAFAVTKSRACRRPGLTAGITDALPVAAWAPAAARGTRPGSPRPRRSRGAVDLARRAEVVGDGQDDLVGAPAAV